MDKIFADGLDFREPRQGAPDFVIGSISVNPARLTEFCKKHVNERGYVNFDVKRSKGGKLYVELNTYVPQIKKEVVVEESEIPF